MFITNKSCPFCGENVDEISYGYERRRATSLDVYCPFCQVDISLSSRKMLIYGDDKVIEDLTADVIDVWDHRAKE